MQASRLLFPEGGQDFGRSAKLSRSRSVSEGDTLPTLLVQFIWVRLFIKDLSIYTECLKSIKFLGARCELT
ncbi:hypothetical protein [Calothrix sp. UHCC 0171]|uniref:hypothetical protein n=1 Tax=Calothrix sp. UHCC 0171 TaxID=3110245 RepID=UPI002B1FEB78|nr:hypothetical protein [Calothrix sp. UHCC 0171]MEA5571114.1 hypothetical protein [Calothrix sp. UHCC 0171]